MTLHTIEELRQLQALDLKLKKTMTTSRIRSWCQEFGVDGVYVSFSGGKDSTVLLDIARQYDMEIKGMFCDTGLEYPEIRSFVKTKKNVEWIKPEINFREVILKYGYPIISKEVAKHIYGCRTSVKKKQNYLNRFDGLNDDFTPSKYRKYFMKWKPLLNMPFKISNRCCWFIKEKPSRQYEQQTGRKLILGTMAEESQQRKQGWFKTGCNSYKGTVVSKPMSFWTEQDVLRYIKENSLQYCSIYGDIIPVEDDKILANHKLNTTECQRTGCMFCGFGLHLEKGETRF